MRLAARTDQHLSHLANRHDWRTLPERFLLLAVDRDYAGVCPQGISKGGDYGQNEIEVAA